MSLEDAFLLLRTWRDARLEKRIPGSVQDEREAKRVTEATSRELLKKDCDRALKEVLETGESVRQAMLHSRLTSRRVSVSTNVVIEGTESRTDAKLSSS